MPRVVRENRVTPAPWRITQRLLDLSRRAGPGGGHHVSPASSSRINHASALGSAIGSFANDVRRFSRLLPTHVVEAPELVTIVPTSGFAMMLAHGAGVSSSPSSTTT